MTEITESTRREKLESPASQRRTLSPQAAQRDGSRRTLRVVKRVLAVLAGLAALGGLVFAWLPDPLPVDLVQVRRGTIRVTVDEDGRTRVKDRYVVSAPLLATSARIELHPGDPIAERQLLARLMPLEPALLDSRTQAQAERRVASAVAGRKQAESAVLRARSVLDYATSEIERQRELSRQGATAERALETAELQERTAREELASSEFALRVAGYEVEMARLNLERQSGGPGTQDNIELASPVSGQILRVIQESAGVVQPGTPLMELGDVKALEIVADVLTSDAVHIKPTARAWIDRWGGDAALSAHVRSIEPSAFTRVSALGVEEQRVNVILDLDEPYAKWSALGDGYRVEVRILTWQADNALVVPESAIFRRNERWATFAVRNGRAEIVFLEVGHRNGELAEVLGGLSDGMEVIVHPSDRVAPGVKVARRSSGEVQEGGLK
jgi:HlyD family secretion protein